MVSVFDEPQLSRTRIAELSAAAATTVCRNNVSRPTICRSLIQTQNGTGPYSCLSKEICHGKHFQLTSKPSVGLAQSGQTRRLAGNGFNDKIHDRPHMSKTRHISPRQQP